MPTSRDKEGYWYPYLLIAPTMVTLVLVAFIPFVFAVYLSLHKVKYGKVQDFIWFENYAALLSDDRFWNCLWVAFVFVVIAVPVEFMLGLVGALILNRGIKLQRAIVPVLFIPTMLAPVVVGLLWKIMLAGSWGFLSYNVLEPLGLLRDTSIFASPSLALFGIIFIDIWQWTPFMMLAFYAGLQALPVTPHIAAAVDGANAVQRFFLVTVPMMTPLLVVMGLLRFIDAFKIFDSIFILTRGGPGTVTESPSMFGYRLLFEYWKVDHASALAVLVWIAFFVFCNIFYQVAKRKLHAF